MDKQYTVEEIGAMLPKTPWYEDGDSVVAYDNPQTKFDIEYIANDLDRADAAFIAAAPAIIKQLLARVKELEAVEEMLKKCSIVRKLDAIASIAGYKLHADQVHFDSKQMGAGSEKWEAISFNNGNWKSDIKTDSLHTALQSLTKE